MITYCSGMYFKMLHQRFNRIFFCKNIITSMTNAPWQKCETKDREMH